MNLTTFKDLKVGDLVEFKDVDICGKRQSGKGKVYGFGWFSFTDLVWVTMENGQMAAVPYEEIRKL